MRRKSDTPSEHCGTNQDLQVTIGEQLLYQTTASDTAEVEPLDVRLARAPGIPSSHACSEAGIGHRATHPLLTHTTLQVACSPSSKGGSR